MRLTKHNPETGLYEYKEKARTQEEYNEQRKAVIQRLGEFEDNSTDLAEEIFAEIDEELGGLMNTYHKSQRFSDADVIRYARCLIAELKKKYTKEIHGGKIK